MLVVGRRIWSEFIDWVGENHEELGVWVLEMVVVGEDAELEFTFRG